MRRHFAVALVSLAGVLVVTLDLPALGQDGQALFQKRCAGCHALDADHEGPRLRGVVGRMAGSVKSFTYSAPLQSAGFIWDEPKLDRWLADTESVVADNDMSFRVPKPEERAAIVAYLKSLSTPPDRGERQFQ